ncbi:B12-binding domain-containing radical SAM protein [Elusimicrobiota bacterium]
MKVLLIYPPITLHKLDVSPPSKSALLGLGYIASVLQKCGHTVKILDCMVSSSYNFPVSSEFKRFGISDREIKKNIEEFSPDVVGVSCMFTSYFKDAHNVAKIVKEFKKDIFVVFGGAHASTFSEQTMKDDNIDVLVVGEGEKTVCEVLERYKDNKSMEGVKGTMYRRDNKLIKEQPRELIQNLDEIPFPAWNLLERDMEVVKREHKKNRFLMRKPIGYVLTSRGCPKECYFCSVKLMWGRRWRMRSARNVVEEIEFLKNTYGYREIHFVDDNSSVSRARMYELCDELIKRNTNVKLVTPTGIAIETLDRDVLSKMKQAGFYRLCFGIETGDPQSQQEIMKRINLDKATEIIAQANSLGFWTAASFIIGFPHETMQEFRKTIEFAKKTNLDFAIFYLLVPQPGTQVYEIVKKQGLIDLDRYIDPFSEEWYKISITYGNGFKTLNFSNEQLQDILSGIYREFLMHKVFSMRTYVNLLKKIRSFEDFLYIFKLCVYPLKALAHMMIGNKLSNVTVQTRSKELKNVNI